MSKDSTKRDDGPYGVEVDANGCDHCSGGRTWTVVGPDGVAIGQSFEHEDDALDIADCMNQGYQQGRVGHDDLLAALKAIVEALRVDAPGTPLNNHKYDALGIQANAAIAKAEGR